MLFIDLVGSLFAYGQCLPQSDTIVLDIIPFNYITYTHAISFRDIVKCVAGFNLVAQYSRFL
jgi:hypothetical protein